MPGRRVISDLEISWEDATPRISAEISNPWAGVESVTQTLATWMCGCAGVLMTTHLVIFCLGG